MAKKDRENIKPPLRNVFLTGFMCSGKTTAGRLLARSLGLAFADSDTLAEKRAGFSIAAIAEKSGMAAFRRLEAACVKELAAGRGRVIALGGGVYPSSRWRKTLKDGGTVVFLHCPWPELKKRLQAARGPRPLLKGPWDRAAARAEKLYARRLPFYRKAGITVSTSRLTPAATVAAIIEELKK